MPAGMRGNEAMPVAPRKSVATGSSVATTSEEPAAASTSTGIRPSRTFWPSARPGAPLRRPVTITVKDKGVQAEVTRKDKGTGTSRMNLLPGEYYPFVQWVGPVRFGRALLQADRDRLERAFDVLWGEIHSLMGEADEAREIREAEQQGARTPPNTPSEIEEPEETAMEGLDMEATDPSVITTPSRSIGPRHRDRIDQWVEQARRFETNAAMFMDAEGRRELRRLGEENNLTALKEESDVPHKTSDVSRPMATSTSLEDPEDIDDESAAPTNALERAAETTESGNNAATMSIVPVFIDYGDPEDACSASIATVSEKSEEAFQLITIDHEGGSAELTNITESEAEIPEENNGEVELDRSLWLQLQLQPQVFDQTPAEFFTAVEDEEEEIHE